MRTEARIEAEAKYNVAMDVHHKIEDTLVNAVLAALTGMSDKEMNSLVGYELEPNIVIVKITRKGNILDTEHTRRHVKYLEWKALQQLACYILYQM